MLKLQIQRFMTPWHVEPFQFEYLGQIPWVVSFSKSKSFTDAKLTMEIIPQKGFQSDFHTGF